MLSKFPALAVIVASFLLFGPSAARAESQDGAALLKALDGTHVTLEEGLKASEIAGRPISAKFEIEGGRLQLSVYTASNDGFREALISTSTGIMMSAEKITDTNDLKDAGAQTEAMRAAKVPLLVAANKVATRTQGARLVGVTPVLVDGRPVAKVTMAKAGALTTVNEDIK